MIDQAFEKTSATTKYSGSGYMFLKVWQCKQKSREKKQ